MTPLAALKFALVVLLVGLGYLSYYLYGKLAISKEQTKEVAAQLKEVKEAKVKSDEAVAKLTTDLNAHQQVVTKTITKLVRVPVSPDEKCMSDVLKQALKEDTND